jgi:hypothetical protein
LADFKQQELLGRLDALFNLQDVHLLLMDWIIIDNLLFHIIESERFRWFLGGVNPGAWISSEKPIMRIITKEFMYAFLYIKRILQLARNIIHITFDG